ncbi:MAG: hypothetical protein R2854_18270 [Caldilineaceae bacterium]
MTSAIRQKNRAHGKGKVATMRAYIALENGETARSLEFSRSALQVGAADLAFVRGLAELSWALSLQQRGNPQQAIAYCRRSLAESTDMPNVRTLRLLLALCGVYYGEANTDEIVTVAATYLQAATRLNRPISIGWAHLASGWGHYHRNELESAEADFRAGRHAPQDSCRYVDGRIHGTYPDLWPHRVAWRKHMPIFATRAFLIELGAHHWCAVADSLTKRLRLRQGERQIAGRRRLGRRSLSGSHRLMGVAALTKMRVCIDSGNAEQLEQCGAYLAGYLDQVRKANQVIELIEVEALTARYHIALGATDAALAALARGHGGAARRCHPRHCGRRSEPRALSGDAGHPQR